MAHYWHAQAATSKRTGCRVALWPDHPDFSAILLDDGRVAVIGTRRAAGTTMIEIYDPATEEWSLGTSPRVLRSMPEVVRLPTGKIFVGAGKNESGEHGHNEFTNEFGFTNLVDLYNPETGGWQVISPMKNAREYHAITLLVPDGRVVVTGGPVAPGLQPPAEATKDVEALEPPYFFRGPRPRVDSISSRKFSIGETISLDVSRTSAVTKVILMGTNAITHWMDGGTPPSLPAIHASGLESQGSNPG